MEVIVEQTKNKTFRKFNTVQSEVSGIADLFRQQMGRGNCGAQNTNQLLRDDVPQAYFKIITVGAYSIPRANIDSPECFLEMILMGVKES